MKNAFIVATLAGVAFITVSAWAQNESPAGDSAAPPASASPSAAPASDSAKSEEAAPAKPESADATQGAAKADDKSADKSAPPADTAAATPASSTPAPASEVPAPTTPALADGTPKADKVNDKVVAKADAPAGTATAPATATVAAADAAPATTATAAPATDKQGSSTNDLPPPGAIVPLVVLEDVSLTDAIRYLARQARINYMLDPKIAFGQPGPDGKAAAQPMVAIRWENVTAEQALAALLNNYNLQLTEDPKSKIARITVKDPAAPDPLVTKIIQLKYSSPSNLLVSVQSALTDKRSKVVADVRTSQLVLLATDKELQAVDEMVVRLDTQPKQVLIEAKLVETSMSPSTVKGLDWSGTLQHQSISAGNNLQFGPVPQNSANPPLSTLFPKLMMDTARGFSPATAFLDADGVNVVLSFLNQNSEARVLSAPRTVTLDNEPATISVTRVTPIINVTAGTANTTGGSQITYTNLGVILNVVPRISANNFVNLRILPEVSRKFDTVSKVINSETFQADEYDVRRVSTMVMIPSGNTLVLGGMVQDDVRESQIKVPVLGDIPGLGLLFRQDSKSRQKSNLLIFITPTIVKDEDFQPTKTDFLRNPVPTGDSVEGDWSAWDSGKPKDWSKKGSAKTADKKGDAVAASSNDADNDSGAGVFAPVQQ